MPRRRLVLGLGLAMLGLALGFDANQGGYLSRIRQLELELEGARDDLDAARWEIRELTVRLEEAEETLEVEQQHLEEVEERLRESEGEG